MSHSWTSCLPAGYGVLILNSALKSLNFGVNDEFIRLLSNMDGYVCRSYPAPKRQSEGVASNRHLSFRFVTVLNFCSGLHAFEFIYVLAGVHASFSGFTGICLHN